MEKATLIHCLCNRHAEGKLRMENRDRFSRHWYDLARLVTSVDGIGIRAMNQRELLEEVVTHKMIFFSEAPAKYEKCLQGEMHLVPEGTLLDALKKDYEDMEKNHMFFKGKEIPPLDDILQKAKITEDTINRNEKHCK